MPVNRKSLMFSSFFTAGLILLLLLGETFASYWVFGGLAAVMLWFHFSQPSQTITRSLFWLPVGFLALVGVSAIFSIHLPLSLWSWSFFCLALSFFWLIIGFSEKSLPVKEVLLALLTVGGYVTAVSWVVRFWPDLAELVQGMNLLLPTYGHNHLAALLLLVLPIAWWWLLDSGRKNNLSLLKLLLLLFLLISLLVSFGRTALVLGLLQLLLISFFVVREQIKQSRLGDILVVVGLVFLGVIGLQVVFSLPTSSIACPTENLESKLCKPIDSEVRPFYWRQAVGIVKDNILFGSGPGTFGLAARKYQELPYLSSNFTHNAFLQQLAELGVLGGVAFVALMLHLLRSAWQSVSEALSQPGFNWQKAVMLAVISSYLNALVDFDWSFIGIFVITLILLGILIREGKSDRALITKKWLSTVRVLLLAGLIGLAGVYSWTEWLLKAGLADQAAVFPYFHFQRKAFQTGSLGETNNQRLAELYHYDLGFYRHQLQQTTTPEEKITFQEKLVAIDPWERLHYGLLTVYLENGRWAEAEAEIQAIAQLAENGRQHGYQFDYDQRKALARETIELGNHYFAEAQFVAAGRMYRLAQDFDEWVLAGVRPVFIDTPAEEIPAEAILFFAELKTIDAEYFGYYRDQYAGYSYILALRNLPEEEVALLADMAKMTVSLNEWRHWEVERQLNQEILFSAEELIKTGQYEMAQQYLDELVGIRQLYQEKNVETTFSIDQRLVLALMRLADELPVIAEQNRSQARAIIPWAEEMYSATSFR